MPYPIWLSEDAAEDRKELTDSQERKLLWWKERLEDDVTAGEQVRKSLIPDTLKKSTKSTTYGGSNFRKDGEPSTQSPPSQRKKRL